MPFFTLSGVEKVKAARKQLVSAVRDLDQALLLSEKAPNTDLALRKVEAAVEAVGVADGILRNVL